MNNFSRNIVRYLLGRYVTDTTLENIHKAPSWIIRRPEYGTSPRLRHRSERCRNRTLRQRIRKRLLTESPLCLPNARRTNRKISSKDFTRLHICHLRGGQTTRRIVRCYYPCITLRDTAFNTKCSCLWKIFSCLITIPEIALFGKTPPFRLIRLYSRHALPHCQHQPIRQSASIVKRPNRIESA